MNFDLDKILQSKSEFRQRTAALPIGEKLAILDALHERALALRRSVRCEAESKPSGTGPTAGNPELSKEGDSK